LSNLVHIFLIVIFIIGDSFLNCLFFITPFANFVTIRFYSRFFLLLFFFLSKIFWVYFFLHDFILQLLISLDLNFFVLSSCLGFYELQALKINITLGDLPKIALVFFFYQFFNLIFFSIPYFNIYLVGD